MNKLEGKVSIIKNTEGKVTIRVEDKNSGIRFLEVDMESSEFAEAIFGLTNRPCNYTTRGFENLGKFFKQEPFSFEISEHRNKEEAYAKLAKIAEDDKEGSYKNNFSIQNSFSEKMENFTQTP